MGMRQQGDKSAEITTRHGLSWAGSNNCWERAPGYQQPLPGPCHKHPAAGGAVGPLFLAVLPRGASVRENPWGWDICFGGACVRVHLGQVTPAPSHGAGLFQGF